MKIDECMKCTHHINHMADEVLCRYWGETEHRVVEKDGKDSVYYVRLCPMDKKKK
jgi:hypothetical protein